MTKEDFNILRNSITIREVVESYGIHIHSKGSKKFIRCPFHAGGSERTPSLIIYEGFRGFHCRGCGQGGDVTRFVELYEGVDSKTAAIILSNQFGVPISETGEVPPEVREQANRRVKERNQEIIQQEELQVKLRQTATLLTAYKEIVENELPFTDLWIHCQNEISLLVGIWDYYFSRLKKI